MLLCRLLSHRGLVFVAFQLLFVEGKIPNPKPGPPPTSHSNGSGYQPVASTISRVRIPDYLKYYGDTELASKRAVLSR